MAYGFCGLIFSGLNFGVASDLIHLLNPSIMLWFFMVYILKVIYTLWIIIWNIYVLCLGVRVQLQGLTCASMVGGHHVGFISVNICSIRVS